MSSSQFSPDPRLLLHSSPPDALYAITPRTIMGNQWWAEQKSAAVVKQNRQCYTCGAKESQLKFPLEAHEHYDINYTNGRVKLVKVVALCHFCHDYIHDGRIYSQVKRNNLDDSSNIRSLGSYYCKVIERGENLISEFFKTEPSILNRQIFQGWKKPYVKTPPLWELYPLLVIPGVPLYEKNSHIRHPRWSDWHLVIDGHAPVYNPYPNRGEWVESRNKNKKLS